MLYLALYAVNGHLLVYLSFHYFWGISGQVWLCLWLWEAGYGFGAQVYAVLRRSARSDLSAYCPAGKKAFRLPK